jgi:hypothetical protein
MVRNGALANVPELLLLPEGETYQVAAWHADMHSTARQPKTAE